jgi:CHAT domain-containing protein
MALLWTGPAEPQQTDNDRLRSGTRLTRQLDGAVVDRLNVSLAAGQFVRIEVMQVGSDVAVTLRDPTGRIVVEANAPNGRYGPETVTAITGAAGDYRLEVKLTDPRSGKGSYEVTLAEAHEATSEDGDLVSAHQQFKEALQLYRQHKPDARRTALDLLGRAREYFARPADRYWKAQTIATMGAMLAESGDSQKALDYNQEAERLFEEAGDRHMEAIARNNIGGMLDVLGHPQKALESYSQALTLHRANGDRSGEALVLSNIGKIESDFGNWQSALDYYKQALILSKQAGDVRLEGILLYNIGVGYLLLGEREEAMTLFQQALPLRRTAQDKRGEGDTLRQIANTYGPEKQPVKALAYLDRALAVYLALGDRRAEAETRRNIGRTYAELGRLVQAEASIRQALEIESTIQDRRTTALVRMDLGRVLALAGQPASAVEQFEMALSELRAMGDRNAEAVSLELLARAESDRGNLAEARLRTEEALRLIEENRRGTDSQQLRASFFATRQDTHTFYIDLLMRMGHHALALEASERSRTRSLVEMLTESGAQIRQGVDPKLLDREREISNLLNARGARLLPLMGRDTPQAAALKQQVRVLETEYQDVQSAIRKSSPHYAAVTQPSPLTVKQIQEDLLDGDSLLLEYALGEKRSFLWVVGKNELNVWELPAREIIEGQVEQVDNLLTARSVNKRMETAAQHKQRIEQADAALPQAARRLSDMVIAPAASVLGGKRLVVAPDGALQRLPFAMLPMPGSPEPLLASHEIVVLPSASALAVLRSELAGRKPAPKMLAIFADPVFDRSDPRAGRAGATIAQAAPLESSRILEHLAEPGEGASAMPKIPRLPFTLQEAEQILQVARDPSNLKAVGFGASRAAAISGQLSQYRYVHFATHGYLDTERPSLSALVLSQIDQNNQPLDGFLRVNDIYNTRLSAELVVLSACQTGLGKEVRGEGLMGLTRAFLYAGAPRVVVSLWNVNDRATAGLMSSLYRGMLRDGKRPPAALREAQLEVRKQKQWESPYYWAAFVQHGEWK